MRCHHKTIFLQCHSAHLWTKMFNLPNVGVSQPKKKTCGSWMWCNHNVPFYMAKFLEQGDVLVCPTKFQARPEQMRLIEVKSKKNVQFFTGSSLVLTIKTNPFGRFPTDFNLFSATRQVAPKPGILQLLIWPWSCSKWPEAFPFSSWDPTGYATDIGTFFVEKRRHLPSFNGCNI